MYQYHKWLRSFHAVAKTGSFTLAATTCALDSLPSANKSAPLKKSFPWSYSIVAGVLSK